MKKIKIAFEPFWPHFDPETNPVFGTLLKNNFNIELTANNPDFLFYTIYSKPPIHHTCKKILVTPENFFAHEYAALDNVLGLKNLYKYAQYSITSFNLSDSRNFRMPCYIVDKPGYDLKYKIQDRTLSEINKPRKVLFLHGNPKPFREDFVRKLSRYIPVDCPGRSLNNMSINVTDKIEFAKQYKFLMSFENTSAPNYNTEKITDAYVAKCIPLYWGDPNIEKDFNKDTMINLHSFNNSEEMIEKILQLDSNNSLYMEMLSKNPIVNEELFNPNNFIKFIGSVFYNER